LWRQAQLITKGGLFKIIDGVYQVRNNDTGNLTTVEGPSGLVIIDCMTAIEPAQQGLALFREHVSDKRVVAVIYTHTHIDHYGGVKGLVDPADVASGKVPIIAPGTIRSFDKFAIGENVELQALRLANKGYTPLEAAEVIELPEELPATFSSASPDTILAMPIDILFDFAAIHLIGDKAADVALRVDFAFTDQDETWTMSIRRGLLNLNARRGGSADPQLTVSGPKATLAGLLLQPATAPHLAEAGHITLTGDQSVLATYGALVDTFDTDFPIVTP
jgi:alkyl sulfatase BDS1-like metallo-beta-lactamase superfamily hydrolase